MFGRNKKKMDFSRLSFDSRNSQKIALNPGDDPIATRQAWDDWLEEIEREFTYFKITEPLDKKDALIIYCGKEIARLEKSFPNPTDGGDDYGNLKKKLNDYFKPRKNKHHARYVFLKMRPAHGEARNAYAARLLRNPTTANSKPTAMNESWNTSSKQHNRLPRNGI